jgi:hypothetical protein
MPELMAKLAPITAKPQDKLSTQEMAQYAQEVFEWCNRFSKRGL